MFPYALNACTGLDRKHIETDSLRQRPALPDCNNVSLLNGERGGYMSGNVAVSLLKTPVFFDELQIVSSHNDCSLHLGAQHQAFDDSATDGNVARKRTLFIQKDGTVKHRPDMKSTGFRPRVSARYPATGAKRNATP